MIDDAELDDDVDSVVNAIVHEVRPGVERGLVARFGLHDGMDAAADAVEFAYRNPDRVALLVNPGGYLYRVGVSRALHHRRRSERTLVSTPITVDDVVDVDLQRALRRLSAEQRVAVVLVHGHGYSYADAAALLGVPVSTLNNHLSRGLARLRRLLER